MLLGGLARVNERRDPGEASVWTEADEKESPLRIVSQFELWRDIIFKLQPIVVTGSHRARDDFQNTLRC
jgi:hypothetical protein